MVFLKNTIFCFVKSAGGSVRKVVDKLINYDGVDVESDFTKHCKPLSSDKQ